MIETNLLPMSINMKMDKPIAKIEIPIDAQGVIFLPKLERSNKI